jgi:hypothetical protein
MIARHSALLIATLKRLGLNRNSVPRGASVRLDVVTEIMTIMALKFIHGADMRAFGQGLSEEVYL